MRLLREIGRWWSTVFALDYRSLAVFRIGLGCILLADLILRLPTVADVYTDEGMLPRAVMREVWRSFDAVGLHQWGIGTWSLHALSGDASWQYTLFAASAFFALLLAAGAWTRVATIASFILIVSIHNRVPFVLTSGDTHLRIVLFWAMFLPLGKVWSMDAARALRIGEVPRAKSFVSAATAGLIIQIFILYFFSGLAKWNEVWWNGDGIFMAVKLTIYNTTWSQSFLQYPTACHVLSVATVASEVLMPWLLFVSFRNNWWRMLCLATFVSMHIGILLILSIGLFSYICITIWLVIIPSAIWDRLGIRATLVGTRQLTDRPITMSQSKTQNPSLAPGFGEEGRVRGSWIASVGRIAVQVFCGLMIPFMLAWNVINVHQEWVATPIYDRIRTSVLLGYDESTNPIYRGYEIVGHALGVGQHFQMFGFPPNEDAWFIYRATLRNGAVRDVFLEGREIPADRPLSGRDSIPHHHWRQIHRNLTDYTTTFVRQRLAVFMAERWNKSHSADEQIQDLRIECYFDQFWPTPIPGEARGAVIWGTYPDGPTNAFDTLLNRALQGGNRQGF